MPINFDLLDSKIALNVHDWVRHWWQIDILVVTDTIVSFGPEHNPNNLNETNFGMSHLIGVLEGVGAVTKAHRSTDPLIHRSTDPLIHLVLRLNFIVSPDNFSAPHLVKLFTKFGRSWSARTSRS